VGSLQHLTLARRATADMASTGVAYILTYATPTQRRTPPLAAYSDYDGARYYNVFYWLDLGMSLTRKQALHAVDMTARKRR